MRILVPNVNAAPLSVSLADVGGTSGDRDLPHIAALAATTLLAVSHPAIKKRGFTISRSWSTDFIICMALGTLVTLWTSIIIISSITLGDKPCLTGYQQCLQHMSYVPWLLQVLFVFWIIGLVEFYVYEEYRRVGTKVPGGIWHLESYRGVHQWKNSINRGCLYLLYFSMLGPIAATTYGSIYEADYTNGLLNLVGLLLFIFEGSGPNSYDRAPHNYSGSMVRVVLGTDHSEGTVYILPSHGHGFDAVWSPKIRAEHETYEKFVPQVMAFRAGEIGFQKFQKAFREGLSSFCRHTDLTDQQLLDLVYWLYRPLTVAHGMRKIRCKRRKDMNLIGASLMYALCHAEFLIFANRERLPELYKSWIDKFRNTRLSVATVGSGATQTVGFSRGSAGYVEAVKAVYEIMGQELDVTAAHPFGLAAPEKSNVLRDYVKSDIDNYVSGLWDYCTNYAESTFAALYAFTVIWQVEVGNGGGFHGFPLEAYTHEGDLVSWHVMWRQAWYSCTFAQLAALSPVILNALLGGSIL